MTTTDQYLYKTSPIRWARFKRKIDLLQYPSIKIALDELLDSFLTETKDEKDILELEQEKVGLFAEIQAREKKLTFINLQIKEIESRQYEVKKEELELKKKKASLFKELIT